MFKKISLVLFTFVCLAGVANAGYPKFIDRDGDVRVSQLRPFMIALIKGRDTVYIKDVKYKICLYKNARKWLEAAEGEISELNAAYETYKGNKKAIKRFIYELAEEYTVSKLKEGNDKKGPFAKYRISFEVDGEVGNADFSLRPKN